MEQRNLRVAGVIAVVTALAVGGVALGLAASDTTSAASAASSAPCGGSAPKLTVQGTGNASATPNVLTVSVDIDVTDPSAQASLVDDNTKASAVTAVLNRGGVAPKDIQTSNVSIQPQLNLAGTISGYEMTNTITAELRNFSTAGAVLDSLTTAAGNATRIDSLTFSIEDPRARRGHSTHRRRPPGGEPRPVDGPGRRRAARAGVLAHRPVDARPSVRGSLMGRPSAAQSPAPSRGAAAAGHPAGVGADHDGLRLGPRGRPTAPLRAQDGGVCRISMSPSIRACCSR